MSEDLEAVEDWVGGLIANLEPPARRQLARAVSIDLRRESSERIAAQKNPDGSSFAPRKAQPLRAKRGRIKRRAAGMFAKLRRPAFLRADATENEAAVGFPNALISRIARVHQEGLRDKVSRKPGAPTATYPARVLLGFNDQTRQRILDTVMKHLQS